MAAELTQGTQEADHVILAQRARDLITHHDGQLVDTVPVHFFMSIYRFRLWPERRR